MPEEKLVEPKLIHDINTDLVTGESLRAWLRWSRERVAKYNRDLIADIESEMLGDILFKTDWEKIKKTLVVRK